MPTDEQQREHSRRELESGRKTGDRLSGADSQRAQSSDAGSSNTESRRPHAGGPSGLRVLVLLCTYNERLNLPTVLQGVWDTLPSADVLVIDDNSPDGTGQWAREAAALDSRINVIVRSGKLGLGSALRAGFQWALSRSYDFIINLDADQSHDPRAIDGLLQCAREQPDRRVAIGSRYVPGGASTGLSFPRQLISRMLNWYATRLLRLPMRDCSGSFRCYPTELLGRIDLQQLTCQGYGFLEEVLVHLSRAGAQFREIPITYHARGSGRSKLRLSDAWGALLVIHRLALGRWR